MTEDATAAAPGKAQKKRTPRNKKPGTPLSKLIVVAVRNNQSRKGTSIHAIKKFLSSNGVDTSRMNTRINMAVNRLVKNGVLRRLTGVGASGSFVLAKKTLEAKPTRKTKTTTNPRKTKTRTPKTPKRSSSTKKTTKKSPAKKTTTKKSPAKKTTSKKTTAKKTTTKKTTAKKTTTKKTTAKKTTAKKTTTKKTTARKPAAKRSIKPKKIGGARKGTPTKRSRATK